MFYYYYYYYYYSFIFTVLFLTLMTTFRVLVHLYNLRFVLSCGLFHSLKVKCRVSALLTIGRVIQAPFESPPLQ